MDDGAAVAIIMLLLMKILYEYYLRPYVILCSNRYRDGYNMHATRLIHISRLIYICALYDAYYCAYIPTSTTSTWL